jgi:putative MATE family efflux protein
LPNIILRTAMDGSAPVQVTDAAPTTANLWRQLWLLTLPALAHQLLRLAVDLSDQLLVGYCPLPVGLDRPVYLAALTTAGYVAWFLSSCMVIVSVGSTALVARFIGAGERELAVRVTNQSLTLAVVVGCVATAVGLLGLETFISWLQLQGPAARAAVEFLTPVLIVLPFQVLETAGIACLNGAGDTRSGMWVLGGLAVLNLPLAWGLCFGIGPVPALGFVGVAWGTAIAHVAGGSCVLLLLLGGRAGLWLRPTWLWLDVSLQYRLLRVSVPAALDSLSVVAGQFWFLSIVNSLGQVAASAHGIALRWEGLGYMSGQAVGIAAMTLVGQNLGAGRPEVAARCGWTALQLGVLVMTTMGAVFFLLAEPMFRLLCPDEPSVIEQGVPVLRLVAFAMPALACVNVLTASLRGAGDTRWPVLFTWIGFLGVRIPLAYGLTWAAWGLFGTWVAMVADLGLRGGLFLLRFASGAWQKIKV